MKTTLVLGAGVSSPYGYPLGPRLVEMIKEKARSKDHYFPPLLADLKALNPISIDEFLSHKKEHVGRVSAIIAEILYGCEDEALLETPLDDNFYQFFFNKIGLDDFINFQIITFNYDRSLEFYFLRALSHRLGTQQAREKLAELKIVHLHGRMSPIPGEITEGDPTRGRTDWPYGHWIEKQRKLLTRVRNSADESGVLDPAASHLQDLKAFMWRHGTSSFKTVHYNSDVNSAAKEGIFSADRVFFLGFSYHPLNMRALGFSEGYNLAPKVMSGTCWGLGQVEINKIKKDYPGMRELFPMKPVAFFRNKYSLDDPSTDSAIE